MCISSGLPGSSQQNDIIYTRNLLGWEQEKAEEPLDCDVIVTLVEGGETDERRIG